MANPLDIIDDRRVARSLGKDESVAKVQDYLDLDAAGFLLVALGHLVKAVEQLEEWPKSEATYRAKRNVMYAEELVRRSLKLLDEQKEETCEKS